MNISFDTSCQDLSDRIADLGLRRVCFHFDPGTGALVPSHPALAGLARAISEDRRDFASHEAIFIERGAETGLLLAAFVHDTRRGQAQGGLRYRSYTTVEDFLRDGLRLARGMTRKNALAGLWWGGGKGIVVRGPGRSHLDPGHRTRVFRDYARFVTSLRGCYVTAEDAGTTPSDMAVVHRYTRFATCIPPGVGGSGNPSPATARGVVCAMEAALSFAGLGGLEGKTVTMQGVGNVASTMIDILLAKGVTRVRAAEVDPGRIEACAGRWDAGRVEIRRVSPDDVSILEEPCDILAPNALGGVLNPVTVPRIQASIVCGAANNQLLDEARDGAALAARGILYVPDFVANRMGIVHCANEQYGHVPHDRHFERHFDPDDPGSIHATTLRVLELANREGIPSSEAANRLADQAAAVPHPIWGHRGRAIIEGLVADGWAAGP